MSGAHLCGVKAGRVNSDQAIDSMKLINCMGFKVMTAWRRAIELSIEEEDLGVLMSIAPPPPLSTIFTHLKSRRGSLPQLCWGRWREAPDGVWRAASTQVGLHDRHCEPTSIQTCFPHPIRPFGPPSPLRGEGGDSPTAFNSMTCVNAVAHKRGRECRRPSVSLTRATRSARRFLGERC